MSSAGERERGWRAASLRPLACWALVLVSAWSALSAGTAVAADGKAMYQTNCQGCHGVNGVGGRGPKLAGKAAFWEFGKFKNAVLNGVGYRGKTLGTAMPRWGKMGFAGTRGKTPTDAQLKALQTYLQSVK